MIYYTLYTCYLMSTDIYTAKQKASKYIKCKSSITVIGKCLHTQYLIIQRQREKKLTLSHRLYFIYSLIRLAEWKSHLNSGYRTYYLVSTD